MDLDVSQDSFAFSDVVPPSHVSDLQSFSDLEFSDSDTSFTESSHTHGSEEENNENASRAHSQDDRRSEEKGRERYS